MKSIFNGEESLILIVGTLIFFSTRSGIRGTDSTSFGGVMISSTGGLGRNYYSIFGGYRALIFIVLLAVDSGSYPPS